MTSFRQIEANRRNALRSTGPRTEGGRRQSRRNALRHGLTAETVIDGLEDSEDYRAFEETVIADYDAQTAVERELLLRLASLLWRLRRIISIETDLLKIQSDIVRKHRSVCRGQSVEPEGGSGSSTLSSQRLAQCVDPQSDSRRARAQLGKLGCVALAGGAPADPSEELSAPSKIGRVGQRLGRRSHEQRLGVPLRRVPISNAQGALDRVAAELEVTVAEGSFRQERLSGRERGLLRLWTYRGQTGRSGRRSGGGRCGLRRLTGRRGGGGWGLRRRILQLFGAGGHRHGRHPRSLPPP